MASKSLTFDIFGRDKSASSTMRNVGKTAEGMGAKFKKVGKAIGLGLAAVGAGLIAAGVDAVKSLMRIEKLGAQTAAVIKSTGGAANVTAKHLNNLADSLEKTTSTEAESIVEGANLLLTFKNIKNAAGQGNDVFDQTTEVMVDMARAMGTDVKSGAIQLGKALNDPIMGISALSRVGVTFSKDQQDLIKTLVKSGKTMDAQKIILKELQSEFGGSGAAYADTFAGKMDNLGNRFGDVTERIMSKLMPALGDLMDFVEKDVLPGVDGVTDWITDVGIPGLKDIVDWIVEWKDVLGPAAAALGVLTGAQWLLNIAMDANPIGIVILALGALITAATLVATNWDAIWNGFLIPISKVEYALATGFFGAIRVVLKALEMLANGGIVYLENLLAPINAILAFAHQPQIKFGRVNFTGGIDDILAGLNIGTALLGGWRPNSGANPSIVGQKPRAFADGGLVRARPGGIFANLGEGRHDEVVLPLSPQILNAISGGRQQAPTFIFEGAGGELARLFNVYEQKADGRRVLVQKMGKQVTA